MSEGITFSHKVLMKSKMQTTALSSVFFPKVKPWNTESKRPLVKNLWGLGGHLITQGCSAREDPTQVDRAEAWDAEVPSSHWVMQMVWGLASHSMSTKALPTYLFQVH